MYSSQLIQPYDACAITTNGRYGKQIAREVKSEKLNCRSAATCLATKPHGLVYSSATISKRSSGSLEGHGLSEPNVVLCPLVIGRNDPYTRSFYSQTAASDATVILLPFL